MNILLPSLQTYLKTALMDIENPVVKQVEIRPEIWLRYNLSAVKFPAVFVWENRADRVDGLTASGASDQLQVSVTVMMQSTDQNIAMFDETHGVFNLAAQIRDILGNNKALRTIDRPDGACTGLKLPISSQSFQYPKQGSFYIIGRVFMVNYIRELVPWHSWRTDENSLYSQKENRVTAGVISQFE